MIHENEIRFTNGFPRKKSIIAAVKECDNEPVRLTFCADYGDKKAGILWKSHSMDDSLKDFLNYASQIGIDISRTKFHGQIHSIWFKQNNDYL